MTIQFVAKHDSITSMLRSLNIDAGGGNVPMCPLQVGDVIATGQHIYLRVVARVLSSPRDGDRKWYVMLDRADDPFEAEPEPRTE